MVVAERPKLLSGGNPQIPKGEGDGPVQTYLDAMPGWKQPIGRAIDRIVSDAVPGVRKAVKWNTPLYGMDGETWFLSFHCFDRYVKVAFHNGGALDPQPPVASKHPHVRYWHIHEGETVDEAQLRAWVVAASGLPGERL